MNKLYILIALFLLSAEAVHPQFSFKTSRLKDSEIFNFFQQISGFAGDKYLFKIESANDFFLDFVHKSKHANLIPKSLYEGYRKDYSKTWSKNKMLYFAVSNSVDCKYDHETKAVLIGDSNEFNFLARYLNSGLSNPVILDKVFKPAEIKKQNSLVSGRINEFIFCLDIENTDDKFKSIFSIGVFSIKKEFESEGEAAVLLQNCQMVLGLQFPSKDDLFVKRDAVEGNSEGNSGYDLYHIGISCFVKRVILFNKAENKIISDINIE